MSATCTLCQLPAPTSLALLQTCLHCFHTTCLRQYVQQNGRCPLAGCARPANIDDIRDLIFDPPQPNGVPIGGQAGQQDATATRVWEVLNATLERLKNFSTGGDQEQAQVAQVGEAFELILREKNAELVQPPVESGWDKLMAIIKSKEVKMVVVAAVAVLICVFFWQIVGPGGLLASEMGEMVTGLLAFLRGFAPEILGVIAAAGSILFGFFKSKKVEE